MNRFPELGEEYSNGNSQKDLLAREKELLGDDAADFDNGEIPETSDAESETAQFESNFPAVSETDISANEQHSLNEVPLESVQQLQAVNLEESEFIKDWKAKNEVELERRDKLSAEHSKENREKAQKDIDAFYENYNSKKVSALEDVGKDAERFTSERDAAVGSGTVWDRTLKLLDGHSGGESDKARFRELLESLRADESAPGAI